MLALNTLTSSESESFIHDDISNSDEPFFDWSDPPLEKLVDREDQIGRFTDVLDRIRGERPFHSTLFEFHGGPGIGKSQLLRLLAQECDQRGIAWVRVDFSKPITKQTIADPIDFSHLITEQTITEQAIADPTLLIEYMAEQLNQPPLLDPESLSRRIQSYRELEHPQYAVRAYFEMTREDRLYNRPDWLERLRNVVASFIGLVNALGRREKKENVQPVVIFFDETERATLDLTDWIEEWIISSLIQAKHCVIVWTARRPWRWKLPEIRRRIYSEQLRVFPQDESTKQLRLNSDHPDLVAAFFRNVHELTNGHPAANAVMSRQIDQWTAVEPPPHTLSQEHETELLKGMFNDFILNYAFKWLRPDEKAACKLLSLVRLFDTVMLREILKEQGGKLFKTYNQEDFGDLLLRLKRSQLLVWNKGYALDPDLRYLLHTYFLRRETERFIQVNKAALEVYKDWLTRPVDNRNLFVIEELYHYASLQRAKEKINLAEKLQKRLEQYPDWFANDQQALQDALDRLQGELKHDSELERLTDGFSSTQLADQVQTFLNSRA